MISKNVRNTYLKSAEAAEHIKLGGGGGGGGGGGRGGVKVIIFIHFRYTW